MDLLDPKIDQISSAVPLPSQCSRCHRTAMAAAAYSAAWHGSATHGVIAPDLELLAVSRTAEGNADEAGLDCSLKGTPACFRCATEPGCPLCRGLPESRLVAPVGDANEACDPSEGGSAAATPATLRGAASAEMQSRCCQGEAEDSEDAEDADDENEDVEARQENMHKGMQEEGQDSVDVVCAKKLPALQPQAQPPGQLAQGESAGTRRLTPVGDPAEAESAGWHGSVIAPGVSCSEPILGKRSHGPQEPWKEPAVPALAAAAGDADKVDVLLSRLGPPPLPGSDEAGHARAAHGEDSEHENPLLPQIEHCQSHTAGLDAASQARVTDVSTRAQEEEDAGARRLYVASHASTVAAASNSVDLLIVEDGGEANRAHAS